ncbi:MAG: hypothetical protein ACTHLB_11160 [Parafilimonas sp.]
MKKLRYLSICFFAFLGTGSLLHAQQIPLNQNVQNRLSELLMDADSSVFTGFRSQNWLELDQLNIIHKSTLQDSAFGLGSALKGDLLNTNMVRAVGQNSVFTLFYQFSCKNY